MQSEIKCSRLHFLQHALLHTNSLFHQLSHISCSQVPSLLALVEQKGSTARQGGARSGIFYSISLIESSQNYMQLDDYCQVFA